MACAATIAATALLCGCNNDKTGDDDPQLIARVGNCRLTRDEVASQVPAGVQPDDSTAIAQAYVRNWLDTHIMSRMGERYLPHMDEIDRLTAQYRDRLIAMEYRRLMLAQHAADDFTEDTLTAYYNANNGSFTLNAPIIKGLYIKIANDSPSLRRIKTLYTSSNPDDMDRLEKEELRGIIHYENFTQRWVDWYQVDSRIPGQRQGDHFLRSNKTLEASDGTYTHLLSIIEYMPTGATAPYDYARESIIQLLQEQSRLDYETRLRLDLYNQGLEDGTIYVRQ